MQGIAVRLYGLDGCPHCVRAASFLVENKIPGQLVSIANDPICSEGLGKIAGTGSVTVPVLVNFMANPVEIVVGFNEEAYIRVRDTYNERSGNRVPVVVPAESHAPAEAAPVANAEASA